MANRNYAYQYDTSPRKIKPNYDMPRKKKKEYNKPKQKIPKKNISKSKKTETNIKTQKNQKEQKKLVLKTKFSICIKCIIIFAILFLIILRNSQISQAFSQIQSLKMTISEIEKENDQLEINIQNSINLSNIEEQAKALLGMQKLTSKQTEYIDLQKKDYVEPRTEEVIIDENNSWLDSLIEKIKNLF